MYRNKLVTAAFIIFALAVVGSTFGQSSKRKRTTGKTKSSKASTQKKPSTTTNSTAKSDLQTESTQRNRGDTTLGDVVVVREDKSGGNKNIRANETGLGGPDSAAELDKSSTKLQESKSRKVRVDGQDAPPDNARVNGNSNDPNIMPYVEQQNVNNLNSPRDVSHGQATGIKPGTQKPFQGTTMEGGDIRTKDTTKKPTGPDIPKPDIKTPTTTVEKPAKTEKPKRQTRRPRKRT